MALGVGLVVIASWKRNVESSSSKFKEVAKALITTSCERFFPLCGKNPWLAKLLSPGQGPRTAKDQSLNCVCNSNRIVESNVPSSGPGADQLIKLFAGGGDPGWLYGCQEGTANAGVKAAAVRRYSCFILIFQYDMRINDRTSTIYIFILHRLP